MSWWRLLPRRRAPSAAWGQAPAQLGTRPALGAALEEAVAVGRPAALLLLDVDGFRAARTSRGEAYAATLLRLVTERLLGLPHVRCFGLGGDRFAVLVPRAVDPVTWLDELDVDLTRIAGVRLSVGTARVASGLSASAVLSHALQALRTAKRRGDGSVVDADRLQETPEGDVPADQATALLDILRESYLRVQYHPIVALGDGRTIGFEALARPHLDHGLAGLEAAMELAARLGLIPELDAVCRHSIFSDGPGFDLPSWARLHVNVSPLSLGHRSLGPRVLDPLLREAGLTADRVVLEISDRQAAVDDAVVETELRRLSRQGFVLALDEIGGGGGGMRWLRTGLFGMVKIAGDVVAAAPTSPASAGVIEAVCASALRTGTVVVADGIEDAASLSYVRTFRTIGQPSTRIDAAQGAAVARPGPRVRHPDTSVADVPPASA